MLVAAHAAAELVQVGQPVAVGLVDEDRVGVGDVQAALDDRGAQQHVELAPHEVQHHPLQLVLRHLGVADDDGEPRARSGGAAGPTQMPEHHLERVMLDFVRGKFDMLLSTTIVESGLDIPNANTIFIDEADRYGLADLHQLRGRVGRYKHRAYCYLLIDPNKHIPPNAARRLRAIEEFSDLGAGFAIAMRNLEIRGAGNILGTEQSGHIALVGYELYCELLEQAVRQLKRLPPKTSIDVDLNLPGHAYLPRGYVPDLRLKIDLYRRLGRVTNAEELADFRRELLDRFGPPPPAAEQLLRLASLRIAAHRWGIEAMHLENRYVVSHYTDERLIRQLAAQSRVGSAWLTIAARLSLGRGSDCGTGAGPGGDRNAVGVNRVP